MLLTIAIAGYRSVRDMVLPLQQINVITGANGSGKSSLYRAIWLLADVAQGRVIGSPGKAVCRRRIGPALRPFLVR